MGGTACPHCGGFFFPAEGSGRFKTVTSPHLFSSAGVLPLAATAAGGAIIFLKPLAEPRQKIAPFAVVFSVVHRDWPGNGGRLAPGGKPRIRYAPSLLFRQPRVVIRNPGPIPLQGEDNSVLGGPSRNIHGK